jgi:hypothetical protein
MINETKHTRKNARLWKNAVLSLASLAFVAGCTIKQQANIGGFGYDFETKIDSREFRTNKFQCDIDYPAKEKKNNSITGRDIGYPIVDFGASVFLLKDAVGHPAHVEGPGAGVHPGIRIGTKGFEISGGLEMVTFGYGNRYSGIRESDLILAEKEKVDLDRKITEDDIKKVIEIASYRSGNVEKDYEHARNNLDTLRKLLIYVNAYLNSEENIKKTGKTKDVIFRADGKFINLEVYGHGGLYDPSTWMIHEKGIANCRSATHFIADVGASHGIQPYILNLNTHKNKNEGHMVFFYTTRGEDSRLRYNSIGSNGALDSISGCKSIEELAKNIEDNFNKAGTPTKFRSWDINYSSNCRY